ncbi:MAG: hypothetical protein KF729_11865 [Sandaracinaceae bacterium]|nr:hypothetical protein [Sandaracinaceae bacterium]
MHRRLWVALWLFVPVLAACGGGQVQRSISSPFTAEHEPIFANGLDLVRDPEGMGGSWLRTWEDELDARVSNADLVLGVTVRTIRHDSDLDRRSTFRLFVHVDHRYYGEVEEELVLVTREGEAGFPTVRTNERRLLDQQFVAFVKWQRDEATEEVRARWHLSPATETVVQRVRTLLARHRQIQNPDQSRERVIIRRH